MRIAILFALLTGCTGSGVYCAVDRDGSNVAYVTPADGQTCGVFSFANLLNVQVLSNERSWKVSVPYDNAEALDSAVSWSDGLECDSEETKATWTSKLPGFDFSIQGQCAGETLRARFYGYMPVQ